MSLSLKFLKFNIKQILVLLSEDRHFGSLFLQIGIALRHVRSFTQVEADLVIDISLLLLCQGRCTIDFLFDIFCDFHKFINMCELYGRGVVFINIWVDFEVWHGHLKHVLL